MSHPALTPAQRGALQLLAEHGRGEPARATHWQSELGILDLRTQTAIPLIKLGYAVRVGDHYEITDAGREALRAEPAKAPLVSARRAPTHVKVYSTVVSERRFHRYAPRKTIFLSIDQDTPLEAVLAHAGAVDAQRVFITGDQPRLLPEWWYLSAIPDGWRHGAHYLADPAASTGRYYRLVPGSSDRRIEIEICQARAWFGAAGVAVCEQAWAWLSEWAAAAAPEGRLLSSPVTTGRDLWRRTLSRSASYPVLSEEVRQLVHATSPQHRRELLCPVVTELPGFAYLDARLAYAAVSWGLPVGPGEWVSYTRDPVDITALCAGRGRYRVRTQVPDYWAHVGILPCADTGGAWEWPSEPGRKFETWADACELQLALRYGWPIEIIEGFRMAEGKPLNTFTDKITRAISQVERSHVGPVGAALRSALRAMYVGLIGGFAQRSHDVWKSAAITDGTPLPAPAGSTIKRSADGRTAFWIERHDRVDLSFAHPEWAATIWARARCRLLDSPEPAPGYGRIGALNLPRESVIAFSADALYLDHDPAWPDDGMRGRFRRKGKELDFEGYLAPRAEKLPPWPSSWDHVHGLRQIAESHA